MLEKYKFVIIAVGVLLALGFIVSNPLLFFLVLLVGYIAYQLRWYTYVYMHGRRSLGTKLTKVMKKIGLIGFYSLAILIAAVAVAFGMMSLILWNPLYFGFGMVSIVFIIVCTWAGYFIYQWRHNWYTYVYMFTSGACSRSVDVHNLWTVKINEQKLA